MKVLALDPGLTRQNPAGLAVVDTDVPRLLYIDKVLLPIDIDWYERLTIIAIALQRVILLYQPLIMAWEIPPLMKNAQTLIKLSHIGGVAAGVAAQYGLLLQPVSPIEAKQALTGNDKADKADMIRAVKTLFGYDVSKDQADAVGIALAAEALARQRRLVGEVAA